MMPKQKRALQEFSKRGQDLYISIISVLRNVSLFLALAMKIMHPSYSSSYYLLVEFLFLITTYCARRSSIPLDGPFLADFAVHFPLSVGFKRTSQ